MKYGGLELVDSETAKTNLLCKWVIKAMELGSPTFNSCLGTCLHNLTHKEEEAGGLGLNSSQARNIKDS